MSDYICTFDEQPDIIALSETKLQPDTRYSNLNLDGYTFMRSDSATQLGGAGLYIKESLTFATKRNLDCDLPHIEETWIDLETNFGPITIGVVYRHPVYIKNNANKFEMYLYNVCQKLNSKSHPYCIFGYFDLDLLKIELNNLIKNYANTLLRCSCKCLINQPTRALSQTLPDHVYCSNLKHHMWDFNV